MTREEVEALVARYRSVRLDDAEGRVLSIGPADWADYTDADGITVEDSPGLDDWRDALADRIEATETAIRRNDVATVEPLALEMLAGKGDDFTVRLLCRRLLEVQREALWTELRSLQGNALPKRTEGATQGAPPKKPTALLSEVIAGYDRDVVSRWKPRSAQMAREGLAFFLTAMGDKPIGDVTGVDLREYRAARNAKPNGWQSVRRSAAVEASRPRGHLGSRHPAIEVLLHGAPHFLRMCPFDSL